MDYFLPTILQNNEESVIEMIKNSVISNYENSVGDPEKKGIGNGDFLPIITSFKFFSIGKLNVDNVILYEDSLSSSTSSENNNNGKNELKNYDILNDHNNNDKNININNDKNNETNKSKSKFFFSSLVSPSLISTKWKPLAFSKILSDGPGLVPLSKHRIFPDIKLNYFKSVLTSSASRPSRTEDDYEYPDELPIVKINRFQSFRAREVSSSLQLSGDDLISSSMFYQLWIELKNVPNEKLRTTYSHPMDDGQSRTFKVINRNHFFHVYICFYIFFCLSIYFLFFSLFFPVCIVLILSLLIYLISLSLFVCLSVSFSLSLTHTHILSLSLSLTHTHTFSPSLTHSLSLYLSLSFICCR